MSGHRDGHDGQGQDEHRRLSGVRHAAAAATHASTPGCRAQTSTCPSSLRSRGRREGSAWLHRDTAAVYTAASRNEKPFHLGTILTPLAAGCGTALSESLDLSLAFITAGLRSPALFLLLPTSFPSSPHPCQSSPRPHRFLSWLVWCVCLPPSWQLPPEL